MPGQSAGSPNSWPQQQQQQQQQQQDLKGAGPRLGSGAVANTPGAPESAQGDGSDMEDEGHSTGSRMPSGIIIISITLNALGIASIKEWAQKPVLGLAQVAHVARWLHFATYLAYLKCWAGRL